MAILLSPMSAVSHLQHHMTSTHGQSVSSDLPLNASDVVAQSASKRPKLSLQTSSLSNTYGSLTRGVAPNTAQPAYTPTTANTLSNTWDLAIRPSPISRTGSPRPVPLSRIQTGQQPYTISLPFGVKPILKNSPLPPRAASVSASPRDSRRKVFFPQPKRVAFSKHLEELIETKQYVAKHSDLISSEEEGSDGEQQQEHASSTQSTDSTIPSTDHSPPPCRKRKIRRDSGIYLDTKTAPSSSSTTTTMTVSSADENTDARLLSHCKRRKGHFTSASLDLAKDEAASLRSRSGFGPESEPERELQPVSARNADNKQHSPVDLETKEGNGEAHDFETGQCSSPLEEEQIAKIDSGSSSTPEGNNPNTAAIALIGLDPGPDLVDATATGSSAGAEARLSSSDEQEPASTQA